MANKSNMKCNRVVPSDRPGKKKMVKACEGGKEKLIILQAADLFYLLLTQEPLF